MKINGRTKSGKPRVLECSRDGNELYLWIHSPESTDDGGWEIWVPTEAVHDAVWPCVRKDGASEASSVDNAVGPRCT